MKELVIIATALLLVGCGGNASESATTASPSSATPMSEWEKEQLAGTNPLADAARHCDIGSVGERLTSPIETTLTFDTRGKWDIVDQYHQYDTLEDIACVLEELNAPLSIGERLDHTRAIDGMQTASWGNIEATWTYHPDSGLWLVLEQLP